MKSQLKYLPWDLLIPLGFPVILLPALLGMEVGNLIFRAGPWGLPIAVATAMALGGSFLLFRAKLPGFQAGIFNQAGSRHLPPATRKLYRQAYTLILPGCLVLVVLCVKFAIE